MKFRYSGVTRTREEVVGTIEAPDEIEVRNRLRAMQVRPLAIVSEGGPPIVAKLTKLATDLQLNKPIELKGLVIFTRQFSSLIDSGVPVVQCLDILWQQEKRPAFKKILGKIKSDIEAGSGLADAISRHRNVFSEFFIRIIEAGETSGTLDKSLHRIGAQLEKLGRIRSKVIGAMVYPVITMVVAIGVLIFLLVKVIPEVSKLYAESSAQLPELTLQVLALSKYVQDNIGIILGGIFGLVISFTLGYRTEGFRKVWDPFFIRLPLFGSLAKKSAIARFTRTMSTLLQSGVPLLTAFEISTKLIENRAIRGVIQTASAAVQEGKSISSGLQKNAIFPPMVIYMVSIGELTGRLDELLGKVADIFDDEVDDAISALTGMLQPAMIVCVGALIAFLLVAMYLPIFQLADKASGGM